MPKTGEKYVSENVGTEFLNQDKVKGIDKVTYDKLVKKISDYVNDNKDIKDKESVIKEETGKLPKKYGSSDSKTDNNQKASSNQSDNIKTGGSIIERQSDAKQRIAFYQNKKKVTEIKNIVLKQKLISHKRG